MGLKHIETLTEAAEAWRDKYSSPGDFEEFGQKEAYMAGAKWMQDQFSLHGTDGCPRCPNGRVTLYATLRGQCVGCAQAVHGVSKDG